MNLPADQEYVTVADIARVTGASKPTVRKAVRAAGVKSIWIGKLERFPRAEVETWLKGLEEEGHGRRSA